MMQNSRVEGEKMFTYGSRTYMVTQIRIVS